MELLPSHDDGEIRAARNQSLFRSVNERMATLNEAVGEVTGTFAIACECHDVTCIEMIEVEPELYQDVRADPRRFLVRVDHVAFDVEIVIRETPSYAIVEKVAQAGEMAERLAREPGA